MHWLIALLFATWVSESYARGIICPLRTPKGTFDYAGVDWSFKYFGKLREVTLVVLKFENIESTRLVCRTEFGEVETRLKGKCSIIPGEGRYTNTGVGIGAVQACALKDEYTNEKNCRIICE